MVCNAAIVTGRNRRRACHKMRVGLLVLGSGAWLGGVTYTRTIAKVLRSVRGFEPVFLVGHSGEQFAGELERGGHEVFVYDEPPPPPRPVSLALGLAGHRARSLEAGARAAQVDCVLPLTMSLGARSQVAWIGWMWDFQHIERPEFFPDRRELSQRTRAMRRMACEAPHLIASSHHALGITLGIYPWLKGDVTALRFPAFPEDWWYERDPSETARRLGIDRPFVYLPNQFWKHKDHGTAFRAWAHLASPRPLLVCTGDMHDYRWPGYIDQLRALLRDLGLEADVRLLGRVDRTDQIDLFRAAAAVLNPSLYEGWSTSVEEARALGKPLVLTDLPLFREQAPAGTRFFPASTAAALAASVEEVLAAGAQGHDPESERAARQALRPRIDEYGTALVHALTSAVQRGRIRRRLTL